MPLHITPQTLHEEKLQRRCASLETDLVGAVGGGDGRTERVVREIHNKSRACNSSTEKIHNSRFKSQTSVAEVVTRAVCEVVIRIPAPQSSSKNFYHEGLCFSL